MLDARVGKPSSDDVQACLTDLYQITMLYAYWCNDKHLDKAYFEVTFRKNPFDGTFCVLAGVDEVVRLVNTFHYTTAQIDFLRQQIPQAPDSFWMYIAALDCSEVKLVGVLEGTIVFAKEPVLQVHGPLGVCQLLETPILALLNFASLVATNAARFRIAAGPDKALVEFGLRRAQGPNGGLSSSKYSYLGGFDATSNVLAAFRFGIPVAGTMAHSFVTSFESLEQIQNHRPQYYKMDSQFIPLLKDKRQFFFEKCSSALQLDASLPNEGELAAFASFALEFPESFSALVDTYSTEVSGIPNFIIVMLALREYGYTQGGIRLDSGDLCYLSRRVRSILKTASLVLDFPELAVATITASNNINEEVLYSLSQQGHEIDTFGIGTHLVTCQAQPALGMVYKLSELNGRPVMKLSQDIEKATMPGHKALYRFFNDDDTPILDLVLSATETPPEPRERFFCQHLTDMSKRCYAIPQKVVPLLVTIWDGKLVDEYLHFWEEDHHEYLKVARQRCAFQLRRMRQDHLRHLNPTPYKISASAAYAQLFKRHWDDTSPVETIR
ncbi:MAG: hypothetical protein KVP17_004719 [Porospora cf. gigantea B]|uniref:uncharacterized protein n=1 Tax=Porospora cf. gigantea B TaxID=2853592 RepID=UPI0035719C16|nr:MAG: hypothetical protein KVP17_004719 [Porospora cf. gigantea B]